MFCYRFLQKSQNIFSSFFNKKHPKQCNTWGGSMILIRFSLPDNLNSAGRSNRLLFLLLLVLLPHDIQRTGNAN